MNTYRVWFDDGSAVLENAATEAEARGKAISRLSTPKIWGKIVRVEQVNQSQPTPA